MGIKPPKKRRKVNQHKPYTFRNKNSEGNKSKKEIIWPLKEHSQLLSLTQ